MILARKLHWAGLAGKFVWSGQLWISFVLFSDPYIIFTFYICSLCKTHFIKFNFISACLQSFLSQSELKFCFFCDSRVLGTWCPVTATYPEHAVPWQLGQVGLPPGKARKKEGGRGRGAFSWCQIGTNSPQTHNKLMYLYNNGKLSFFNNGIVK